MVNGASSLARKFNISELAIGFTVVAMGTSAPEFVVNLISGMGGHNEVVFGNIIGSNIFNLFLILGIAGLIYPLTVQTDTVKFEIPFSLAITIVLLLLINDREFFGGERNQATLIDGIILFVLFISFLIYVYIHIKAGDSELNDIEVYGNWRTAIMILGGMTGLVFGGKIVVDNAVDMAQLFGVSEKLIGLTIVAAGTSLPELATSAMAARKRKSDIAIGNILGSNIFNILFVLAINAMIMPLEYNPVLNVDILFLLGGTILLFLFMFTLKTRRLDRMEASFYLLIFVIYMIFVIIRK
jgi:cation:H+ antiporter